MVNHVFLIFFNIVYTLQSDIFADYRICPHVGHISDVPKNCSCEIKPETGCDVCCVVLSKAELIRRCTYACAEGYKHKSEEFYEETLERIIKNKQAMENKIFKGKMRLPQEIITTVYKPPQQVEEEKPENTFDKLNSTDPRCFDNL